jgi:hypothetical protein
MSVDPLKLQLYCGLEKRGSAEMLSTPHTLVFPFCELAARGALRSHRCSMS